MSVPTFDQMRKCTAPIWQNEDYQTDILWAGVFGSVARNRAHEESDVDILIVLKEHERSGEPIDLRENLAEACGREISLMCIWQGPDWAWGHVRLEALLSSRSVYGNHRDVDHLRRDAMAYLNDGLERLELIAEAVQKIKNQVTSVQTYENFIHPAQQAARQECVQELRKVVKLLDIHPLYHPIRTMLISLSFEHADQIRALLDQDPPDINGGAAPVWRTIWDHLQPTSATMWAFDAGCAVGGRNYIRHILASKRLADRFEEGGQVDDTPTTPPPPAKSINLVTPPNFAYSLGGVWDNPNARATVDEVESARARAQMAESPPALEEEEYEDTESAREGAPPLPPRPSGGRTGAFFRSPTSLLLDLDRNETDPNWICRLPFFPFKAWTNDSRTSGWWGTQFRCRGQELTRIYSLVAAVRDGVNPSRVYAEVSDVAVKDFPVAISSTIEFTQNSTSFPPQAGYTFYTSRMDDIGLQLTMDLHAVSGQSTYTQTFVQTLVLDNTPYVKPGAVSTVASSKSAAVRVVGGRSWEVWHALVVVAFGVVYLGESLLGWAL